MNANKRMIRVLIAKLGLDGHDRGVKVIVLGLRDEGMEVIYTGLRKTAKSIVHAAIQEDVDVIGLSLHSGGHMYHFPKVLEELAEQGMTDVLVIAGGIIPEDDARLLEQIGIKAVFGPGTQIDEIAKFIRENVSP